MSFRSAFRKLTPTAWVVIASALALGVTLLYAALEGGGR